MKLTIIYILVFITIFFIGCSKGSDDINVTPGNTATVNVTPGPTPVKIDEIKFMIESFDDMDNPDNAMKPINLSAWGIEDPALSIISEDAEESSALKVELNSARRCQAFQIDDAKRIFVFKENAKNDQYLRIFVVNPGTVDLSMTIQLRGGSGTGFPDSNLAVITDVTGKKYENITGNTTDDAGADSSIAIPAKFAGWVAWPLSDEALKPWSANNRFTEFNKLNYIRIDVRSQGASDGDYYILDGFCLTNVPNGELGKLNMPGPLPTRTPVNYDNKVKELNDLFTKTIKETPQFEYCPEYDPTGFSNIKAIWFTGPEYNGKKTKVFAYIGFPEGASENNKVPAVVLQHGGGGFAFPTWVKKWTDLGYAAIAVANTGFYPAKEGITDFYASSSWSHTLAASDRVLPPNNDSMFTSTLSFDKQWMYHAVNQTIIANNILRADKRIDSNKVGITGISWGGVIASTAIGYDTRFAFAIPVYGSGYLYESLAWIKDNYNSEGTKELWDPSINLKKATMPVLWLGWTDDNCFSINSQDKSFADTKNGVLSMKMNMQHGHFEGWGANEIYRFADSVVKNGKSLVAFKTQPGKSQNVSCTITKPDDASYVTAKVYYIKEKMTYSRQGRLGYDWCDTIDQSWFSVDCDINGDVVTAKLPKDAHSYYVEVSMVVGKKSFVTTSSFITISD